MSKTVLTAAQIGCGKFAHHQDLPNLSTHEQINLKWVCDINLANAEKTAKEFNVPCLDLFVEQAKAMEEIGEAECAGFYCIQRLSDRYDPSHTNIMGAHFLANIIATELSKAKTPLAKEINKKRLWKYKLTVKKPSKK